MTSREAGLGLFYLSFQLLLLPELLPELNRLLPRPMGLLGLNMVFYTVNFLSVLAIFHRFLHRSLLAAGERFPALLLYAGLGFSVYFLSSRALGWVIGRLFPGFSNVNDATVAAMARANFYAVAFATVVPVTVAEEALYRGIVFHHLRPRSRAAAYLVSAALFSTIHVAGYLGTYRPLTLLLCFLQYLPAGLCLGWAYEKTGTIFAPILIHAVVNALGVYALR